VPGTGVVPWISVNVDAVTDRGSITLLKVAAILRPGGTPVAPFGGSVELSIGAVESEPFSVVKVHT